MAPICMHNAPVPLLVHYPCVHGSPFVFHRPCIAHALLVCGVWKVPRAFTYMTTICMHNAVVTISDLPPVLQFVCLFSRTTHCPCMVGVWCMEGPQGLQIHVTHMHAQCCGHPIRLPPPVFHVCPSVFTDEALPMHCRVVYVKTIKLSHTSY